jgi:hypothetical protein
MRDRGLEVDRNTYFETYQPSQDGKTLDIKLRRQSEEQLIHSRYLIGCKSHTTAFLPTLWPLSLSPHFGILIWLISRS